MAEQQIVTRAWARRNNIERYFTGKPCLNDHIAERVTHSSECVQCRREKAAARNRAMYADAARYRYLREHGVPSISTETGEGLDRAIDAAMGAAQV